MSTSKKDTLLIFNESLSRVHFSTTGFHCSFNHNKVIGVKSKAFLSNYVHTLGDMMRQNSNSHLQRLIPVHLPTCLKKEDIKDTLGDMMRHEVLSFHSFYNLRSISDDFI